MGGVVFRLNADGLVELFENFALLFSWLERYRASEELVTAIHLRFVFRPVRLHASRRKIRAIDARAYAIV